MNISRALADFVADTQYDHIPAYVIENQKKSVLDAIGITFGASTLGDGCREMIDIAEALAAGGKEEATVMAFGKKLPAIWAAFANASPHSSFLSQINLPLAAGLPPRSLVFFNARNGILLIIFFPFSFMIPAKAVSPLFF